MFNVTTLFLLSGEKKQKHEKFYNFLLLKNITDENCKLQSVGETQAKAHVLTHILFV